MSGNRRSEDAGEVPWPALVDLLTSVLITFMFFVLLTTVAMSAMSLKTAANQNSKNTSPSPEKTSSTEVTASPNNTVLPPPVNAQKDILAAMEQLEKENKDLKAQLASLGVNFTKSKEIDIKKDDANHQLTLLFHPNEAGTTPQSEAAIAVFVNGNKGKHIKITAVEPMGLSQNQARERALTRAMVIRNTLIENNITPAAISIEFLAPTPRYKSNDWLNLEAN